MRWIGSALLTSAAFFLMIGKSAADDVQVTAEADRTEIAQDESVAVKISIETQGGGGLLADPEFSAPDFVELNSYQSSFLQSTYENGQFIVKNTRQVTKVLRPTRTGKLTVSKIMVSVNGKSYSAPDIIVSVGAPGQGTAPPPSYGGVSGLSGSGKNIQQRDFFLRAELNKQQVFKGEQLVVSYYLYRRVGLLNIEVTKYPTLSGFLKEDLELPVMQTRLSQDVVVLDGAAYQRSLLARYATYPLKDGKLNIDSMALRFNYYPEESFFDDPGGNPFSRFFQQMTPRQASRQSEVISVEVLPLPSEGRPDGFQGAVGDFSVVSALDRYKVKTNEALTLTIKVEGRGNLSSIQKPELKLPDGIEIFESKDRSKNEKGGVGEKLFEYLLIPRQPGQFKIDPVDFVFFNPEQKSYVSRSTEAAEVVVTGEASQSVELAPKPRNAVSSEAPTIEGADLRYLKPMDQNQDHGLFGVQAWRWLYWLSLSAILVFAVLVAKETVLRSRTGGRQNTQVYSAVILATLSQARELSKNAEKLKQSSGIHEFYELLAEALLLTLEEAYGVTARSLAREDLERELLTDKKIKPELWAEIRQILEFSEQIRFAGWGQSTTAGLAEVPGFLSKTESIVHRLEKLS